MTQAHALVHGDEANVFGDADYQGVDKREETQDVKAEPHIAMRPGKRRALNMDTTLGQLLDEYERLKASIRAKVPPRAREVRFRCQLWFLQTGQVHCPKCVTGW